LPGAKAWPGLAAAVPDGNSSFRPETRGGRSLVYFCDWLPPDYGAVGQYSQLFARQLAEEGYEVTLVGLSSRGSGMSSETCGTGSLREVRLSARAYDKASLLSRMLWTVGINTRLVWRARRELRRADAILLTGSPPYLLHWLAPLNVLLRKKLIYRITDFHPECLVAQRQAQSRAPGLLLRLIYRLTLFWRRRVDEFEALGLDQVQRLIEAGIARERIRLKPDPSPVAFHPAPRPLPRPEAGHGRLLMLYSGNWGVVHDYKTFVSAYALHHRKGTARFVLWLNAVGAAVQGIEDELTRQGLPYIRGTPVPLHELAPLLVTPDVHLITLSDPFVGYVLPSKVHGCIASGLPVLYVGSERSDVHRLCSQGMTAPYRRAAVDDVEGCWRTIEDLASVVDASVRDRTAGAR
jgi:hypothetical protein